MIGHTAIIACRSSSTVRNFTSDVRDSLAPTADNVRDSAQQLGNTVANVATGKVSSSCIVPDGNGRTRSCSWCQSPLPIKPYRSRIYYPTDAFWTNSLAHPIRRVDKAFTMIFSASGYISPNAGAFEGVKKGKKALIYPIV